MLQAAHKRTGVRSRALLWLPSRLSRGSIAVVVVIVAGYLLLWLVRQLMKTFGPHAQVTH